MSASWPIVELGGVVRHRQGFVEIDDTERYKRCRVQLHAKGIVLRDAVDGYDIKTKRQQVCRAGDLLVAEIDAKVGGYGIVPPELDGAIVSSHYFLFDIDDSCITPRFLYWLLKTRGFAAQVEAQGSTNYASIRSHHVLKYEIPLPSLMEQRRIVLQLDSLTSKIDEAILLRVQLDALSTAFWPAFLREEFQALAQTYGTRPLGDLCIAITDGPHKTPTYFERGVPFVTVKNMVSGKLDFTDVNHISPEDHSEFSKRCRPQMGDVLYSKDGATRGRSCFVDTDREFNIFVSVALIKPIRDVLDGRYVAFLLDSGFTRDRMMDKSRGDMIPHIVLREIRNFPVPTPPRREQRRIADRLEEARGKHLELLRMQGDVATQIEGLRNSVLSATFGEASGP